MAKKTLPKISVGVASTGDVRIETAMSLMAMVGNTPNMMFNLVPKVGCYVHMNRENIVLDAQKEGATHLLFVDSDMEFQPNALSTLLKRNKPIIGADYNFKFHPPRSTTVLDPSLLSPDVHRQIDEERRRLGQDKEIAIRPIYDDAAKTKDLIMVEKSIEEHKLNLFVKTKREPFPCRAIGTGFALIQMWVFDKIPRPWFFFRPEKFRGIHFGTIGEDVWFCDAAHDNSIEVWCDPTIQIRHVGIDYF